MRQERFPVENGLEISKRDARIEGRSFLAVRLDRRGLKFPKEMLE